MIPEIPGGGGVYPVFSMCCPELPAQVTWRRTLFQRRIHKRAGVLEHTDLTAAPCQADQQSKWRVGESNEACAYEES
jgi:hypothetical protein